MPTKLHAAAKPEDSISHEEILETLLVEAGAAGQLPTNESKLLSFLGLEQMTFDFTKEMDFRDTSTKPPGELRAALHLAERVVATQSGMGVKRKRFSIFHEIAHCVLPEHNSKIFFDSDQTLSWWTKSRFEREANRFAADLLFQGRTFAERALSSDMSIQTVLNLAPLFGASYEASLRRYAEMHVLPCALIVYNKAAGDEGSFIDEDQYKIQYTIASMPFRKLYFSGVQTAEETFPASDIYGRSGAGAIGQILEKELAIEDSGKERWRFESELFTNGYKIFQFLKGPVKQSTRR